MRWVGHIARIGERRVAYTVLMRKPEAKRPLGLPSLRSEGKTEIHFQEVGWGT
jgi:hypothetical protein